MSETDRVKLAEERKLIFANLVNGVARTHVMEAFKKSDAEIDAIFGFVATKVISYRFERALPYVNCRSLDDAIRNRALVLHSLDRINLQTDAKFPKVQTAPIDPYHQPEIERRIREKHAI